MQIKEHGKQNVLTEISISIRTCALALNITLSEIQLVTLCNDVIDVYHHDSIEDVRECLKMGRRGVYGFGHNSRNSLNMILISEWMQKHLEKKAIEREKLHKKNMITKEPLQNVDYKAYHIRMEQEAKEKKEDNKQDEQYNNFKHNYLNNQKK